MTLFTLTFNTLYTLQKYFFPHFPTVFICRHVWRQLGNRWIVVLKGNRALAQPRPGPQSGQTNSNMESNGTTSTSCWSYPGRPRSSPDRAVFAANNMRHNGVMRTSSDHNLTQPSDLSVNQTASERTLGVKRRVGYRELDVCRLGEALLMVFVFWPVCKSNTEE